MNNPKNVFSVRFQNLAYKIEGYFTRPLLHQTSQAMFDKAVAELLNVYQEEMNFLRGMSFEDWKAWFNQEHPSNKI